MAKKSEIDNMMKEFNDTIKETTKENVKQNVIVTASGDSWVKTYWRPLMAWQYMAVCLFDFFVAPVITILYYAYTGEVPYIQWKPLTLEGGGLYHLAMGAVLGITSWSRGQEKIKELTGQQ